MRLFLLLRNRSVTPQPWRQVGLAIVPGLFVLSVSTLDFGAELLSLLIIVGLTVGAVAAAWAVGHWHLPGVPVWGFVPLGLLAFMGFVPVASALLSALIPGGFANLSELLFISTLFGVTAAGLLLAKHGGLYAGLFVLSAGVPLMGLLIEQVIYFWDSPFWKFVMNASLPVLFYVVAPIWVLRARSIYHQAAGLLSPVALYFVTLVNALITVRRFSVIESVRIGQSAIVLFVAIACAVVLYLWVSARDAAMKKEWKNSSAST